MLLLALVKSKGKVTSETLQIIKSDVWIENLGGLKLTIVVSRNQARNHCFFGALIFFQPLFIDSSNRGGNNCHLCL